MATFQERVVDYVGPYTDTDALDEWLTAGAKLILSTVPESYIGKFAVELSVPALGLDLTLYRLFGGVHKDNYPSVEVSVRLKQAITDENSRHYGTVRTPAHLTYNKRLFIYVNGVATTGNVLGLDYPTVLYSEDDIANYPSELIHGVVLYTAIQVMIQMIIEKIGEIDGVVYNAPAAPSITIAGVTIGDIGIPPVYVKPSFDGSYTNLIDFIRSEEDLDKAQEEARMQGIYIEEYGKDLYNELNEYNSQLEGYKLSVESIFRQADIDTTIAVKNAELQLGEYQTDVQAALGVYTATIQKKNNEIQPMINILEQLRKEYQEMTRLYR